LTELVDEKVVKLFV